MKIIRKIRICVLLLAVLAAALCGCVKHKHIVLESRWVGDFCFSIYEDGTAEITSYRGTDEVLKLPNLLGSYPIIGFGTKAFDNCPSLKEVLIPPTVTSLPAKLFNSCENLERIYIPSSVRSVGVNVIFDCPAFTTVLYSGSRAEWDAMDVGSSPWTDNYVLINAEIVYDHVLDKD